MRRRKQKKDESEYPPYWDITSLNQKKDIDGELQAPITSTGPVDITKLPGFTTCRTGQPTNIINDKDINPPSSNLNSQIIMSGSTVENNSDMLPSPQTTETSNTLTNVVSNPDRVWPPDVSKKNLVTPSTPVEYTKPDIGRKY